LNCPHEKVVELIGGRQKSAESRKFSGLANLTSTDASKSADGRHEMTFHSKKIGYWMSD
jgi:hypothetical protein